ncbi:MAG: hypothetical protein ABWY29_06235 [Blastococcus sp.]
MTTGADWLDQGRRLLEAFLQTAEPGTTDDGGTGHRSDCTWCPICQVAAVVRGERPEVSAALADVLDATAAALRTFAASAGDAQPPAADEDPGDGDAPPAVQRIEIA